MSKAVPHVPLRGAEDRGNVAFGTNHGPEGRPVFGPSRASRKCAQLLSEALTARRLKRSQLLSTRTFQAGSEAGG